MKAIVHNSGYTDFTWYESSVSNEIRL